MFDIGSAGAPGDGEPDTDLPPEPWSRPCSTVPPDGYAALELQDATHDPADLTDAEVVEAVRAYDHLVPWPPPNKPGCWPSSPAAARPSAPTPSTAPPAPVSTWAPDEIGLALTLSRGTAADRIDRSVRLTRVLPATLAAWQAGLLDQAKVNAIHDATLCLSDTAAQVVQHGCSPKPLPDRRAATCSAGTRGHRRRPRRRRRPPPQGLPLPPGSHQSRPRRHGLARSGPCCPPPTPWAATAGSPLSRAAYPPAIRAAWTPAAPT